MPVLYNEKEKVFALNTKNTTYMMGIADDKYPGHLYYGKKLSAPCGEYLMRTGESPLVPSKLKREMVSFMDSFPMEYPAFGIGDFRDTCLTVRTEAGHRGCELHLDSWKITKGKPGLTGLPATFGTEEECQTLDLIMKDPVIGLKATLRYSCFEDVDAITRTVLLENESDRPLYLEKVLSTSVEMDNDRGFELITLSGSWAR